MQKKAAIIILVLSLLITLNGCIYAEVDREYELQQDVSEISTINIYVDDEGNGYPPETPQMQIAPETFAGFVSDLQELPFTEGYLIVLAAVDPSFFFGRYTVEIIYHNGGYELISNQGYQEYYDATGDGRGRHYNCDPEIWEAFILKYLSVE